MKAVPLHTGSVSIPTGGGNIDLHVGSGGYISKIIVNPGDVCPSSFVRVNLVPVNEPSGAEQFSIGQGFCSYTNIAIPLVITERTPIPSGKQYMLRATVRQISGAAVNFGMSAIIDKEGKL